jgi:hypothetical protein
MNKNAILNKIALATLIIVVALILGSFSTTQYVLTLGMGYLEKAGTQNHRVQSVLNGVAGNPWQYRVLAPYFIKVLLKVFAHFHITDYVASSFIFFRTIQDTIILLLSYAYYRKLKLSLPFALIGMALLAWGMSYSHFDSDLQFNTFFDVIFYLLAGLCILYDKYIWIIPITFLAALNRETSGLIPFLLLAVAMFALPKGSLRKVLPIFITAGVIYVAIFIGLRLFYGNQKLLVPYGHHPGLDLLSYNLFRTVTWRELIATLSIIPIIAIIGYYKWPLQLRIFFWVIVPIWFIIHAFGAVMAEARLFLVPQAMVFIPSALLSIAQQAHASNQNAVSEQRVVPSVGQESN